MQETESDSDAAPQNPNPLFGLTGSSVLSAGSGKTTLMQRLNAQIHMQKSRGYVVNLDPAVTSLPYSANIDIRDTINYKNVMKEYNLGPNGGILTSLNLFATKFDEVTSSCWDCKLLQNFELHSSSSLSNARMEMHKKSSISSLPTCPDGPNFSCVSRGG
jgi:ABC-type lipoprotein export system ATPase subunit